jgi:hypothetical protein
MMDKQPLFDAKAPVVDMRRKEWVSLDTGRLCVWEMEAADTLFIVERSLRPGQKDGRLSAGDAMLWRVLVSCYKGEETEAERVFDITDLPRIQRLRKAEWDKLLEAIERVNGLDPAEVPDLEAFTPALPGGKRHSSRVGASNT